MSRERGIGRKIFVFNQTVMSGTSAADFNEHPILINNFSAVRWAKVVQNITLKVQ